MHRPAGRWTVWGQCVAECPHPQRKALQQSQPYSVSHREGARGGREAGAGTVATSWSSATNCDHDDPVHSSIPPQSNFL
jgi:hypothetical protein